MKIRFEVAYGCEGGYEIWSLCYFGVLLCSALIVSSRCFSYSCSISTQMWVVFWFQLDELDFPLPIVDCWLDLHPIAFWEVAARLRLTELSMLPANSNGVHFPAFWDLSGVGEWLQLTASGGTMRFVNVGNQR